MQDPNSFPPFQPERENSLAEELYPDIFADAFPPIAPGPATYSELKATGKMPRRTSTSTTRSEKRAVRTERATDRVGAVRDDSAPLSLVDALQATITRKQPKRESQFVISGDKKRQRNTDSVYQLRSEPAWQFTPRLRLIILFVVIVLILLAILLFPIALSMS